jgi:hypothetical protein
MQNENLEAIVRLARDKKPTDFKTILTTEINSRVEAKVAEINTDLAKNMFSKITENCEDHEDGEEHTHADGTVHTHTGGAKEHTHDEDVEEEEDEDDSPVGKKDENIANFGGKKAKPFKKEKK